MKRNGHAWRVAVGIVKMRQSEGSGLASRTRCAGALPLIALGLIFASITSFAAADDLAGSDTFREGGATGERTFLAQASETGTSATDMNSDRGTHAQAPSSTRKYVPPYPFTSDELWQKILKVAALPDGYVTHADVERIFGIRLKPTGQPATEADKAQVYVVGGGWTGISTWA